MSMKGSEQAALVGAIDPDAYGAGTEVTGWVNAGLFAELMAVVSVGDFVATGLLDAKIEQAQDSGGTGAKDLTGAAITQLTQAGTDDNKQAVINFSAADLDTNNGFEFVRLSMTLTTAGADAAGYLFGLNPRHGPASDNDASTVDEIVTV